MIRSLFMAFSVFSASATHAKPALAPKDNDQAETHKDYYGLNDPGFVYGFVSLLDPQSGKKHVQTIYAMSRKQIVPVDKPSWFARFRNVETNAVYDVRFDHGVGLIPIGNPPYALSYGLRLLPDQSVDYPTEIIGRESRIIYASDAGMIEIPRNRGVRYDPLRWRFERIEMDNEESFEPYRTLKARPEPFADIPDAPVAK